MRHFSFILTLSMGFFFAGCGQQPSSQKGEQAGVHVDTDPYSMEAVMAIHDEVMPKMGEISMLIDALKAEAEQEPESPQAVSMKKLQESHKAMMDWMREFGDAFTSDEILKGAALSEEKKERLRIEAERIAEVKRLMLESIAEGKQILEGALE